MNGRSNDRLTAADALARSVENELAGAVIAQLAATVEVLLAVGQRHQFDMPLAVLHVVTFAEQIAALTLATLRSWPNAGD